MTIMLDANVMKRDPRVKPKVPLGQCGISQIVLGELEYGVFNSPESR